MRPRSAVPWLALAALACHGGNGGGPSGTEDRYPPPATVAQFTALPVQMPATGTITPLGHIQPVGHVLPTDHVYFYPTNIDAPGTQDTVTRTVVAPGDGVVTWMLLVESARPDWKVMFRMTSTFYYYLDHVLPVASLKPGSVVHAGDVIGTTPPGATLDLGAYDMATTLPGFIVPARYPDQSLRCVSPFRYFVEPLRSQLYARIRRVPSAPDRDGRIDFDVPGRLVGNWFHESVPRSTEASGPSGWPKSLAFARDYNDPAEVRISIGGTIATPGVWTIPADAPRPEEVSKATGRVAYRLLFTRDLRAMWGLLLVEMDADDRIRVQVFEGDPGPGATFDGRAQVYVR